MDVWKRDEYGMELGKSDEYEMEWKLGVSGMK